MKLRRWLTVGIGVKRWLLVAFAGLIILALGIAHVLRQLTAALPPGNLVGDVLDALTLRPLPYELRGLVLGTLGATLFLVGAYRLVRALVDPFALWDRDQPMVEVIYQKRFLARGPRVVALGGGTGLSTLLRGLKEHTSNLTAVVTVADDGGSTGVLRAELGIPAVGDIRNCIVALADAEPLMGRLLQYRFPGPAGDAAPDPPASGLSGHAVGNLLLAALVQLEQGDFEEAVREMNRVLAVRGRVVPATASVLTLHALLDDGSEVAGQSRITRTNRVDRVWVTPEDCRPTDDALRAIADAEVIILGPGSLFTSLLPVLLVPGIAEAVEASGALVVFACNVATQPGETGGFDLADHLDVLARHGLGALPDVVLGNNRFNAAAPRGWVGEPVRLRWPPAGDRPPRLVLDDLVDPVNAHHHSPERLAAAIIAAWEREGGHRRRPAVARPGRTA
ncbi:MAG TPA: gluconeogenesis factor YvcK family protein [Candidatus Limnocylindrales bacterium]|nr:gluconeogenesis factor YvcK family protein [Candidatus Limnocylindrales bacterium]